MIKKCSYLLFILVISMCLFSCREESTDDQKEKFEVIFFSDGGSEVDKQLVVKGEKAEEPSAPTKAYYLFNGWYQGSVEWSFDENPIVEETHLYANWIKDPEYTYNIMWELDGGTFVGEHVDKYHTAEGYYELPEVVKEDHKFTGWSVSGNTITSIDPGTTGNLVITANWLYEQPSIEIEIVEIVDFDATKDVTVNFWHAMGQTNQKIIDKIIENFEELYPNITVVQTSLGDYTTLRDTIASGIATDNLPTIAQTYPEHVSLYLQGKAIRELDSYLASTKEITLSSGTKMQYGLTKDEQQQYIEAFWNEGTIYDSVGTMYSMPFNKSTEVLYYNKTIFDKYGWNVPTTWEEIVEVANNFKNTTEFAALEYADRKAAGFSYDSEANLFITLTKQWGGEFVGFDASGKGAFLFDNAQSKAAMKFYKDAFDAKQLVTTTYFETNYSSDAFKAGQTIMMLGSTAGASYNVPSDGAFTVGVAPYPQKAGSTNKQVIQQGTNVSLFKCDDAQEELAGWLFMKFLTNYESALLWCTETAYFPIRKDVLTSTAYADHISGKTVDKDGNVIYKPTTQQLAQAVGLAQADWFFTDVSFVGFSKARDAASLIVQGILYDKKSIDKAYQEAMNYIING